MKGSSQQTQIKVNQKNTTGQARTERWTEASFNQEIPRRETKPSVTLPSKLHRSNSGERRWGAKKKKKEAILISDKDNNCSFYPLKIISPLGSLADLLPLPG